MIDQIITDTHPKTKEQLNSKESDTALGYFSYLCKIITKQYDYDKYDYRFTEFLYIAFERSL